MERFVNPDKEVLVIIKGKEVIIEKKYAEQIMKLTFCFGVQGYLKTYCDTKKFKKIFPDIIVTTKQIFLHQLSCLLKYRDLSESDKKLNTIPENPKVNHINRNIYDNSFKNLEYTTQFMNASYYSSNRKTGCYYHRKDTYYYWIIQKSISSNRKSIINIRDDYKRFKYELFTSWLSIFLDTLILQNKSLEYIKTYAQLENTRFKQRNQI